MNRKVYIHEFIDIIGHGRARYMHHMTANYSPIAQEDRNQSCYGVWGVVGTTGRWPAVVNIWEEDGFDGLASSFRHEFSHPTLQDPKLAAWWAEAAKLRAGGVDRVLVPAPWTRTIDELCADAVRGEVYAHEQVSVPPGTARDFLDTIRDQAERVYGEFGWSLVGAWETAMADDSECFVLWAIPRWEDWAAWEKAQRDAAAVVEWQRARCELTTSFQRILLVDSPLCPFRTGRQPRREDRVEEWRE